MHSPVRPSIPVLIERLLEPAPYPHPTEAIRLVETHISWVILTGPFAYKLKKPVSLGFVDYTTLDLRRRSCEGEVRVSGRFAPELYVAAVPITGSGEVPCVGGEGEPIEYAVKLVQFDEADRLDSRFVAGRLTAADCRALGEAIAAVEECLPAARPGDPWGTADSVFAAAAVNLAAIRTHLPEAVGRVDRLESWLRRRLDAAAPLLVARQATGRVRECHGDLHLAGAVLDAGRTVVIDATCIKRWQRDRLAAVALDRGVPLIWVVFDLPTEAVLARLATRQAAGGDPSDASVAVVRRQLAASEPLANEEAFGNAVIVRVAATDGPAEPAAVAERVVRARSTLP